MNNGIVNLASKLRTSIVMDADPSKFKKNIGPVLVQVCNAVIYGDSPWKAAKRAISNNRRFAASVTRTLVASAVIFAAGYMARTSLYKATVLEKAKIERTLGITRANLVGTEAEKDKYMTRLNSILKHKDYMRFIVLRDANIYVPDNVPTKDLRAMFTAADEYRIPYGIYFRLVNKESGFNDKAVSPVGAAGYTQIMPQYYQHFLDKVGDKRDKVLNSMRITGYMLRTMFDKYSKGNNSRTAWSLSLAAYNAGPGNVEKYSGVPPFKETTTYVSYIIKGLQ